MKLLFVCMIFCASVMSFSQDEWLIMLYQDADDYQLEQDIMYDLNEAELVGSSNEVTIISQMDRYAGSYDGDGDWSGTRRYLLTADNDMSNTNSILLEDIGEANMSDRQTLEDFIIWAATNYPAKKYALIMSDHGSGWPGGWSDPDPDEGDMLWMTEIRDAVKNALERTSIEKLDLIGFDACLMGHIEVFDAMAPYCKVAVASQETEPGIGWAYKGFLQRLANSPQMDASQLGKAIVETYLDEDISVTGEGDSSRTFGNEYGGNEDYLEYLTGDTTLSAVNLEKLDAFKVKFNSFLAELQHLDQAQIARARSYSQKYTNIFDESHPSPYIDLGHFLILLKEFYNDSAITGKIDSIMHDYKTVIIAERHGSLRPGASGMSIHFPNSEIYAADWGGVDSYEYAVPDFFINYRWDDFLKAHYTNSNFTHIEEEVETVTSVDTTDNEIVDDQSNDETTETTEVVVAPGSGEITISNMKIDKTSVTKEDIATITADITGTNIAYIYIQVLYYDYNSGYYLIADKDYIEADSTKVTNGVYYPDWSASGSSFEMVFEWEPYIFTIDNGTDSAFALLEPHSYGSSSDNAVYVVDGLYYSNEVNDTRYARCYFNGMGYLTEIYGFHGNQGYGAPYQITPKAGDSFSPYENWVLWDEEGNPQEVNENSSYITIENLTSPFEWYDEPAFPGDYYLGFLIVDYDGNQTIEYVNITVTE